MVEYVKVLVGNDFMVLVYYIKEYGDVLFVFE